MLNVSIIPDDMVPSELVRAIGDYDLCGYAIKALEYAGDIIGYHVSDDTGLVDTFYDQDFEEI